MKKFYRNAIVLFLFLLFPARSTPAALEPVLALTHATVIDATGAAAQPDRTVVIIGDRIAALGKSSKITPPTNAVVVDAAGKFLIPGLWDMHVHWQEKDYLPIFTANGVTGIRIMWGESEHHEWKKQYEQGTLTGPRLFIASTLVDGSNPIWPGSMIASNAASGRLAVTRAREDGADFVKVYSVLPRDAYFAIADESKKQGIPFVGHVPIVLSAEEASNAGQKSIEHLTGILFACSSRQDEFLKVAQEVLAGRTGTGPPKHFSKRPAHEDELVLDSYDPKKAAALFATFKKNGTWQCPTLTVLRFVACDNKRSLTNDSRLKYMPAEVVQLWTDRVAGAGTNAPRKELFPKWLELVGAMHRAGVEILAGTDAENPFCYPGFSLHDELGLLVQAGLSPMEALQSATRNPARFMGREKDLGTIEPGKLADLVLLDANPLEDIANTRKIAAVVQGGRPFSRDALDEMLAKIETLAHASQQSKSESHGIPEKN
jgi:hypothetical protein